MYVVDRSISRITAGEFLYPIASCSSTIGMQLSEIERQASHRISKRAMQRGDGELGSKYEYMEQSGFDSVKILAQSFTHCRTSQFGKRAAATKDCAKDDAIHQDPSFAMANPPSCEMNMIVCFKSCAGENVPLTPCMLCWKEDSN